jgi:hypothetical protein
MLAEADAIEQEYFRLRVKAFIAIVKKFGKRRSEVPSLEREKYLTTFFGRIAGRFQLFEEELKSQKKGKLEALIVWQNVNCSYNRSH